MMASAPSIALQAAATMARSSRRFGANTPGVSISTSWVCPRMAMPRTSARVVCTFCVTAATLAPTSVFTKVDLPALGAPSTATTAQRRSLIADMRLQESGRRRALRVALGARFAAHRLVALDARFHDEAGRMFRAALIDHDIAQTTFPRGRPLLQRGLGVARDVLHSFERIAPEAQDESARRLHAAVQIERRDHRL